MTCHQCTQLGSTAIGVKATDGVVLAVEKRVTSPLLVRKSSYSALPLTDAPPACSLMPSWLCRALLLHSTPHTIVGTTHLVNHPSPSLQVPSSIEKVAEVDSHIGCAMSGLTADARTLIDHGRVEAQVLLCLPRSTAAAKDCPSLGTIG